MKVLLATDAQKEKLEGIYNDAKLQFIKDANDNWVVNDLVLSDEKFSEIAEQLNELVPIEFEPKIDNEEI